MNTPILITSRAEIRHALEAADAAYMGLCCAKELAKFLKEIEKLAGAMGANAPGANELLAKLLALTKAGYRESEVHMSMLTEVHAETSEAFAALRQQAQPS